MFSHFRGLCSLAAFLVCAPTVPVVAQGQQSAEAQLMCLDANLQPLPPGFLTIRGSDGAVIVPITTADGALLISSPPRKITLEFVGKGLKNPSIDLVLMDAPKVLVSMTVDPRTGQVKEISQKPIAPKIRQGVRGATGTATGTASGTVTITAPAGPPAFDECAGATDVGCNSTTQFDNSLATTAGSDPAFSCRFGGAGLGFGTSWFSFMATGPSATIDTNGSLTGDTLLAVYSGTCGALVEIGCDDDGGTGLNSMVAVNGLSAGTTYYVQVAGFGAGNVGMNTLNVACTMAAAPGDACVDAIEIACGGTGVVDNSAYATDVDDPAYSCRFGGAGQGVGTVWFSFTSTSTSARIDTNLSLAFDTLLAVYSGTCGAFTELACSDDEGTGLLSEFGVEGLTVGEVYFIQASSFSAFDTGEITVSVQCPCPAPPDNDDCANAEALVLPASVVLDNSFATDDIAMPCGVASGPFKNVWYSVAGTGTTLTATTCNAGTIVSDTKISVFCADCGELVCVAGNDDNCPAGGQIFSSTVSWCSQVGANYFVTVGNFSGGTASGVINLEVFDSYSGCVADVICLPQGACCLPDGTCVVMTADDCASQMGTYQGDDTVCDSNAIADGSFEAGAFGGTWNEASTNFGTPLCDPGGCGMGGGTGPRTGTWWAWFGGIGAFEVGSVDQDVIIPAGATTLDFWLDIPVSSGNGVDYLRLRIDGNVEFEVFEDDGVYAGSGYNLVSVPIGAYADGGLHNVEFESTITGAGGLFTNFFVDDVSIDVSAVECCFTIDFETQDDFVTPLQNGQAITSADFGNLVWMDGDDSGTALGGACGQVVGRGSNAGLAIFDSTPGGPNSAAQDPDLLVDRGNILIFQNDTAATQTVPGFFDYPNDDLHGGDLVVFVAPGYQATSVVLVDIDVGLYQGFCITLVDGAGSFRTYHVPARWTGDILTDGPPGWRTLDLTTLADQPGFMSTATATEDAGFDPTTLFAILFEVGASGAIDDLTFCR